MELHAAPSDLWQVESSNDLKTWQEYSPTGLTIQPGANAVTPLKIDATANRQFFRARRIN